MTRPWNARSEAERKELEAAFVARHGAELLLDGDAEPPPPAGVESPRDTPRARPRPPFARLHASLHGGGPLPPEVSAALRADPGLREDFALLVRRTARGHLPRAAAAAGREGLARREAGGFVVRLVASRAGRDQVYLLVEMPEEATGSSGDGPEEDRAGTRAGGRPGGRRAPDAAPRAPGQLVVRTAGGEFLKQTLPSPEERTCRLVMAADDPLVRAVAEPASEVFVL